MDKSDLEAYRLQLSQVELALSNDPDNDALYSLKFELESLIELTQSAIAQSEAAALSKEASSRTKAQTAYKPTWSAGDECLARYSADGQWYPARITSVGGSSDNQVFSIVFKGYNTTELVKSAEIKALPPNYRDASTSNSLLNGTNGGAGGGGGGGGAGGGGSAASKRKLTKAEEEERDRKKKKNEKKLEVRAQKAKEQMQKQMSWQKFAKKSEKKGVHIAGVAGTSIFKTPDNPLGRVGVTGSGKGMTEVVAKQKHKFEFQAEDQ